MRMGVLTSKAQVASRANNNFDKGNSRIVLQSDKGMSSQLSAISIGQGQAPSIMMEWSA